jgi:hypothetical protein
MIGRRHALPLPPWSPPTIPRQSPCLSPSFWVVLVVIRVLNSFTIAVSVTVLLWWTTAENITKVICRCSIASWLSFRNPLPHHSLADYMELSSDRPMIFHPPEPWLNLLILPESHLSSHHLIPIQKSLSSFNLLAIIFIITLLLISCVRFHQAEPTIWTILFPRQLIFIPLSFYSLSA